jgi:hypothetical protein
VLFVDTIPASFTSLVTRAMSAFIAAANSSAGADSFQTDVQELLSGLRRREVTRCLLAELVFNRGGRPAGANMPLSDVDSYPGTVEATVGSPGG